MLISTSPRRPAALVWAAAVLTASLALTGCAGLRVESAPPTTPAADAAEQARQAQAQAAADLAATATAAAEEAGPLAAPLLEVAAAADAHRAALGGVWQPYPSPTDGAADPTAGPTDGPAGSSASPAPAPADVLALLQAGAADALAAAATLDDGRLARLLAAIGMQRELAAARLAAASGLPAPDPGALVEPTGLPAGLSAEAIAPGIVSLDALGEAWEVVAARSAGAAREAAADRAGRYRDAAETWARATGSAGTQADPRRVGYDLPVEILDPTTDPAVRASTLGALAADLAGTWLELAAGAGPGERAALLSAARTAQADATELTGQVPTFPGLPEL